jgi:hypothetical protein
MFQRFEPTASPCRRWSRATEIDPARAAADAGGKVQFPSHFIPIDRQDALNRNWSIDAKAEYFAIDDALDASTQVGGTIPAGGR